MSGSAGKDVVVGILLVAGVALELFACLGVAVMRGALARVHYTGPASFGALLLALAVLVREGFSLIANKALLIAAFLLIVSPVLAHVTARAARVRDVGHVELTPPDEGDDG